jgi:hypothetical protein
MRLGDRAVADQHIAFSGEGEAVHLAIEAAEFDAGAHVLGRNRLIAAIGVQAVLRRHAGLEDGDLNGEIAVAKHAATMRSTLVVAGGRARVRFAAGHVAGIFAAGGQDHEQHQSSKQGLHGASPAAVDRSMSASRV